MLKGWTIARAGKWMILSVPVAVAIYTLGAAIRVLVGHPYCDSILGIYISRAGFWWTLVGLPLGLILLAWAWIAESLRRTTL